MGTFAWLIPCILQALCNCNELSKGSHDNINYHFLNYFKPYWKVQLKTFEPNCEILWTTLSPIWKVQVMTFEPNCEVINRTLHKLTRQCPKFAEFTKFLMATSWHQKVPFCQAIKVHGFGLPNHHVVISISLTSKVPHFLNSQSTFL